MADRTTLNVAQDEHKATREVKDEYDESWTDVLQFYREHRPTVSVDASSDTVQELASEIDAMAFNGALTEDEVDSIMSSLETVEERLNSLERQVEELR